MTKQEAIDMIMNMPNDVDVYISASERYVSCSEVERLGVSRQLLKYHVDLGNVKTNKVGRYKRYLLEDVLKIKK